MHRILVICAVLSLAVGSLASPADGPGFSVLGYDLELTVVPESGAIRGTARVEVEAGEEPVEKLSFSLNERLEVISVTRDGKKVAMREGDRIREGRALDVELKRPLTPGKRCTIEFEYVGDGMNPDAEGPDWMGILLVREDEIRMSHQAQWYPIVPRDESGLSKLRAPTKLQLTLPKGMESLGPGDFAGKKRKKGKEVHRWESTRPVQASILAGKYEVEEVKVGKLAVRALAFREHTAGAKLWAREAAETLKTIQARLGKLDARNYGIAEMHVRNRKRSYNYEADGFSVYDSVLFDGRDPDPRKIAHEVAHLWWGGAVDADGIGERFLTESLAELTAYLYMEERDGAEGAIEAARRSIRRYHGNQGDERSVAQTTFDSPRYSQVIYAKGALALRTLRSWIGAKAFEEGLRDFVDKHGSETGAPELADFLNVMRAHGGEAIDAWAEDWLERPGVPSYEVELDEESGGFTLVQSGDLYRNPVELECRFASGKPRRVTVVPSKLRETPELELSSKVTSVTIDPDLHVLTSDGDR